MKCVKTSQLGPSCFLCHFQENSPNSGPDVEGDGVQMASAASMGGNVTKSGEKTNTKAGKYI